MGGWVVEWVVEWVGAPEAAVVGKLDSQLRHGTLAKRCLPLLTVVLPGPCNQVAIW